jgi:hypothetical protein
MHYHFNIQNFTFNIDMKNVLMAAALSAALGSAQAATVSFVLDPLKTNVSVASLLPSNFTFTAATLTVQVDAAGFELSAAALGDYQLLNETHGSTPCPAGSYLFCEGVVRNYVREQVRVYVPTSQSARLTVGSASVAGNNNGAPLTLINKVAGNYAEDSSSSSAQDVVFGYNYNPDGSVTPIYQYLLTTTNYATQDYVLQYDRQRLTLQLQFDAATLASLNSQKSFGYGLQGSWCGTPLPPSCNTKAMQRRCRNRLPPCCCWVVWAYWVSRPVAAVRKPEVASAALGWPLVTRAA